MSGPADPYKAARERYERASAAWPEAKAEAGRIVLEAEDELCAAVADLRRYEAEPGVPLQQYRASAA